MAPVFLKVNSAHGVVAVQFRLPSQAVFRKNLSLYGDFKHLISKVKVSNSGLVGGYCLLERVNNKERKMRGVGP